MEKDVILSENGSFILMYTPDDGNTQLEVKLGRTIPCYI